MGKVFTGLSLIGVGVSNVITARRTLKYQEILNGYSGNHVKAAVKTYYPSFIAVGLTCGSILLAEGINLKEIAAVTGVVTYLTSQRDRTMDAIEKFGGEELREKVETAVPKDQKMEAEIRYICKAGPSVEETGRGDLLCYDAYAGRWFRSCETAVNKAIKDLNDKFARGEYLSLNDFHELLGLELTHFGHTFGWAANPDYYDCPIEFDVTILDEYKSKNPKGQLETLDEPVLVIDYLVYPMECYM